jgi:hypothetical protein
MRFINDNLYPIFGAVLLVIVISCWFALPEPAQPKTLAMAAEPWSLPAQATRDSSKAIQNITSSKLWGTSAADAANAPPPAPKWTVMGIASNGADRFILMSYEGQAISTLRVGDSLPDGMKVAQIDDDRFFVTTSDKKKMVFGIYKNDPIK